MSDLLVRIFEILGIVAFSISGAMVAIRQRMDLFGVVFMGFITSFGGGLIRDGLMGVTPPLLFQSYSFIVTSVLTSLVVFLIALVGKNHYQNHEDMIERINNIFDALGLGVFVVIGTQAAMDADVSQSGFFIISMAVVTGVGGGLLRDMIIREIPFILKKRIYVVAAALGAVTYWLLNKVGVTMSLALWAGVLVTFALRVLATVFKWNFPKAIP